MRKFIFACSIALFGCTVLVLFLIYDQILESAWRPKQKICIENGKFEVIKENGRSIDELYVIKKYETYYPKRNRNNATFWGFPLASATSTKILAAFDTEAEAEEWIKNFKND